MATTKDNVQAVMTGHVLMSLAKPPKTSLIVDVKRSTLIDTGTPLIFVDADDEFKTKNPIIKPGDRMWCNPNSLSMVSETDNNFYVVCANNLVWGAMTFA